MATAFSDEKERARLFGPLGYPAAGLRWRTGLPSVMSLGRTRGAVLQQGIFAGAGGSRV